MYLAAEPSGAYVGKIKAGPFDAALVFAALVYYIHHARHLQRGHAMHARA